MEKLGMIARGGGSLQYFNSAILLVTIFNKQNKGMKQSPVISSLIHNTSFQTTNFITLTTVAVLLSCFSLYQLPLA